MQNEGKLYDKNCIISIIMLSWDILALIKSKFSGVDVLSFKLSIIRYS